MMHYWDGDWSMGWGMGLGWLLMLLFWLLVIGGVVWLIVYLTRGQTRAAGPSALEILKHRYARGEINKEEYEQRKKDLLE